MELLTPILSGCLCTAEFHTPIPSGSIFTANSRPLSMSQCFSSQPPQALVDTHLCLGCQDCDTDCESFILSCQPLHFLLLDSEAAPSFSAYLATSEKVSLGVVTSFLLQLTPQGFGPHPISSFLFIPFLSFILPCYTKIVSCLLKCLRSSYSVHQLC